VQLQHAVRYFGGLLNDFLPGQLLLGDVQLLLQTAVFHVLADDAPLAVAEE